MALVTTFHPEIPCCRPLVIGSSNFVFFRSQQVVITEAPPFGDVAEYPDVVFCLREIVDGESVFSVDFALEPSFSTAISYPVTWSDGTNVRVTYPHQNEESINWLDNNFFVLSNAQACMNSDKIALFCPHPESQLVCFALEDNTLLGVTKGEELWRKDSRNMRYNNLTHIFRLIGVDSEGNFIVAFRERLISDQDVEQVTFNKVWGEDTFPTAPIRAEDGSGPLGSQPAGILWLDPLTGNQLARWDAETRFLDDPSIPRGYVYQEFQYAPDPNGQQTRALCPRPFGSQVVDFELDGSGGIRYIWNDDDLGDEAGHFKWSQANLRAENNGGAGGVEYIAIGASFDRLNPFHWVNLQTERAILEEPAQFYDSYPSETLTWRFIGDLEGEELEGRRGGQPAHSLDACCLTPDGLVVAGPRRSAFLQSSYHPRRFFWRAFRRNGSQVEVVWELELGKVPVEPDEIGSPPAAEDTLDFLKATVPVCYGNKILTVVHDYTQNQSERVNGFVRFVGISATTGELLHDTILSPTLWGKEEDDDTTIFFIHPMAEIHQGRFVCTIQGRKIQI